MEKNLPVEGANQRRNIIKGLLGKVSLHFLELGFLLKDAIDNKDYKALKYERIEDYLLDEFQMRKTTAYNLIGIGEVFGKYFLTSKNSLIMDYTRLVRLLPFARNMESEQVIELLHEAQTLTPQGFEDNLRNRKGKIGTDECEHNWILYNKCAICGKWQKED